MTEIIQLEYYQEYNEYMKELIDIFNTNFIKREMKQNLKEEKKQFMKIMKIVNI